MAALGVAHRPSTAMVPADSGWAPADCPGQAFTSQIQASGVGGNDRTKHGSGLLVGGEVYVLLLSHDVA